MREIKFRAWDGEKMYLDVQDSYDYLGMESEAYRSPIDFSSFEGVIRSCGEKGLPLMQYTGLKDMDGVEIYEGDILEWDRDEWGGDHREVCEWAYGNYDLRINHWPRFCKVIGNRYENPELVSE